MTKPLFYITVFITILILSACSNNSDTNTKAGDTKNVYKFTLQDFQYLLKAKHDDGEKFITSKNFFRSSSDPRTDPIVKNPGGNYYSDDFKDEYKFSSQYAPDLVWQSSDYGDNSVFYRTPDSAYYFDFQRKAQDAGYHSVYSSSTEVVGTSGRYVYMRNGSLINKYYRIICSTTSFEKSIENVIKVYHIGIVTNTDPTNK